MEQHFNSYEIYNLISSVYENRELLILNRMTTQLIVRLTVVLFLNVSPVSANNLSETTGVDSFSSDYLNPTLFSLDLGSNLLTGEVGAAGTGTLLEDGTDGGTDGDYFTLVVPNGLVLNQIFVNRYNQLQRGFAIYAPGAMFGDPIAQGPNVFYPFADGALFAGSGDIVSLPPQPLLIGSANPFDPSDGGFNVDSLGAGTYSLLIQENQLGASEYILDFVVSQVPEPSSLALVVFGSLVGVARRGGFLTGILHRELGKS